MTSLNLTVRALTKFPARVAAGVGMLITKVNGIWTFAFSGANVPPGNVSDPANTDIFVEMPDGSIAKVPVSVVNPGLVPFQTGRRNAFINGGFQVNQRRFAAADFVAATRQVAIDRWGCKTGAGVPSFFSQSAFNNNPPAPDGRAYQLLQFSGNAGMTTFDIDQRIEARNMGPLLRGTAVTFSAYIFNLSGGGATAFTPTLFVETPTALDNWAVSNVQNGGGAGEALQSCPVNAWTRVTWSANIAGYANIGNGIAFRLRIPNGSLDASGKSLLLAQLQVEEVNAVGDPPSLFEPVDFATELASCQRFFSKTFPYTTKPAQNVGVTGGYYFSQNVGAAAGMTGAPVRFGTVMRTLPTLVLFNPSATNALARNTTAAADCSTTAPVGTADSGFALSVTTAAGSAAGQANIIHYTADAEL